MERELDCIVIGGGVAGLAAALVLGRARRPTVVLDTGGQSNRPAPHIGGFLGQDEVAPGDFYFGQTGSLPDLYRHYGIDANAIAAAAQAIAPGRPIRHLRALG
jgi:flavin-dependent dehydrogenase